MQFLLSWLWSRATFVFAWFGNNFTSFLTIVVSIADWARGWAEDAYNRAVNAAYSILTGAVNFVYGALEYLQGQINNIFNQIWGIASGIYNTVNAWFNDLRNWVIATVHNILNGAYNIIYTVRDWIIGTVNGWISAVYSWVTNTFGWVFEIRDVIVRLLSLLTWERISKILEFLGGLYNSVILFFSNPLGFILDVISEKFISFLCYLLAWGLGTTKYDLPKTPPWKV